MDIGERIRYFRTLSGYSVNKLANKAGISQSYLREIEIGGKNPTVQILQDICDTLGVSLKDFFDEENLPTNIDPLMEQIGRLSPKQKKALLAFLNTI